MSGAEQTKLTRSKSPSTYEEALQLIEKMTQRIAELEGKENKLKSEMGKQIETIKNLEQRLEQEKANGEAKTETEIELTETRDKLTETGKERRRLVSELTRLEYELELAKEELASKERYLDDNARKLLEKDREIQDKNRELEELRRQMGSSSIGDSMHQNSIKPPKSASKYPESQRKREQSGDESSSSEQSPVTRVKKLVTNLSIFSGKVNENVSEWIYMADCFKHVI